MGINEIERRIEREIQVKENKEISEKKRELYQLWGKEETERKLEIITGFYEANKKEILRDSKIRKKKE